MSVHLIFEFLTAFVGTIAFALLFQVPKEYYVNCGLAGDDLSRCRHLPAGSGSRDLLDCLLCRDGSAGQSFRPWIPDFEDRGGNRAWHPVCL